MKAKQYLEELGELVSQKGDIKLIAARDAEGNGYNEVYYSPSLYWKPKSESGEHIEGVVPWLGDGENEEQWIRDWCLEDYVGEDGSFDKGSFKASYELVIMVN